MREVTIDLLQEAAPGHGFVIGITEDMPPDRWADDCMTVNRTLCQRGRLPIEARTEHRAGGETP